jgi:hypothetical protein
VDASNWTLKGRLAFLALVSVITGCGRASHAAPRELVDGSIATMTDSGGVPRTLPAVISDFLQAWGTSDAGERQSLLRRSFAPDGVYANPEENADTREGLDAVMARLQSSSPGATIASTTRIDLLRGHFRYRWQIVTSDGTVQQTGEDEGAANEKGTIQRISGFFDPPASGAAPASVDALFRALSASSRATLLTELSAAVSDHVVWTDRGVQSIGISALGDHLVTVLSPGSGAHFALEGSVDSYGDAFRANVTVAGGYAAQRGQLFGRLASDGKLDTVSYFDGDL